MARPSSSSAKKVAKLAQRGRGRKVRFQGGTFFPAVVVGVLVVGLLLIGYSRQSVPDPGSFPPQQGDHWHAAYGMYVCDGFLPKLTGAREETIVDPATGQQQLADPEYAITGVHSHGDGVIHWHPFSTRAVGKRATLGVFLDVYDVELSTDRLVLPADQGGDEYRVGEFQCNGQDVEVKVVAWDSYTDTGAGQTYITDLTDVRLRNDGMVFTIAVVPPGTAVPMPEWAAQLPELGAADAGATTPTSVPVGEAATTVPGETAPPATDTPTTEAPPTTSGG